MSPVRQGLAVVAVAAVTVVVAVAVAPARALQKPERHFGCPPGKNVCIYPVDTVALQCESLFDFQVELHVRANTSVATPVTEELDITLTLPSGKTTTPAHLWEVAPEYRTWSLKAFKDMSDENPTGFDAYAVTWRNVFVPRAAGKGFLTVRVRARGVTTTVAYEIRKPTPRKAKNVVLLIGDGMSLPLMSAARLVSRGMYHGKYKDKLHIQALDNVALMTTSGIDSIITDSANSASSFATGHKSSVSALGVYADSGDDVFAHPKQELITEYIKKKMGMSVGVVTTAEVQDATPASAWAHVRQRGEKAAITAQAINGCLNCVTAVVPDVLMGGGGKFFLPKNSVDGSNMYDNYTAQGYTVTHTKAQMMSAAKNPATHKLLTITHAGNMEVWLDRNRYKDNMNVPSNDPLGKGVAPTQQPNLDEMTMAAIEVLSRNDKGFFLLVEAASIDKSAHPLDVPRTLSDLLELDNTVAKVLAWAKAHGDDTLVLVTADHAHGFDVFGTVDTQLWRDAVAATTAKPVRDQENYCAAVTDNAGTVFPSSFAAGNSSARAVNLARRSAIGIYANAGYPDYVDSDGDGFPDTWDVRTTLASGMNNFPDHTTSYTVSSSIKMPAKRLSGGAYVNNEDDDVNGLFQSGNLPPRGSTGVHTLQDVGIFASGPGSEAVRGVLDNTEVYHIMASALGVGMGGEEQ
ncbi:hypothetical protein MMPV_000146 [Pyropia vietnamensis]